MIAMRDAAERLAQVQAPDLPQALAVISEAVWWVTIVDATLVRYHPAAYDSVLAGQTQAERRRTAQTLDGLRFVRNQMGYHIDPADFACPGPRRCGSGDDRIAAWTWQSVREPALASLPPRGQQWEMTRHRAYQAQLAGHAIGEIFGRATAFHNLAAAQAASVTDISLPAAG
jgi:hypothetical protein